jgi:hypothetical protein
MRRRGARVRQAESLTKLYDQLLDAFSLGNTLPSFWIRSFREALGALVEPAHKDFYRQLAPKFHERFLQPA